MLNTYVGARDGRDFQLIYNGSLTTPGISSFYQSGLNVCQAHGSRTWQELRAPGRLSRLHVISGGCSRGRQSGWQSVALNVLKYPDLARK